MRIRQWRFIVSQCRQRCVPDDVSSDFGSRLDNFILLLDGNGCAGRIMGKVHHQEARVRSDESFKFVEIWNKFGFKAQWPWLQTTTSGFRQVAVREVARIEGYYLCARFQQRIHHQKDDFT